MDDSERRVRERQMVVLVCAILVMVAMTVLPMAVVAGAHSTWSWGNTLTVTIAGSVLVFCVVLMARVQKDDRRRSIFAGRWGLTIAILGLAMVGGLGVLTVVGLAQGALEGSRVGYGLSAIAAGVVGLIRKIVQNRRGQLD